MSEALVRTGLLADVRRALTAAPGLDAQARFEQVAWLALLEQHGSALLTRQLAPAHLTASAAVLTPGPDVASQLLLAVPLLILFELSVLGAVVLEKVRLPKKVAAE